MKATVKEAALALTITPVTAAPKTYQVTGPVLEVNESTIVVQKGNERWEVARDAKTKADGDVKVGDRVTVHYWMTAKEIELKADKAGKADGQSSESAGKKK
jgi:hypothetical protein